MQRIRSCLALLLIVSKVRSESELDPEAIQANSLESLKLSHRDPRFLSFLKNLFQPRPTEPGSYSQKYGEAVTNYDQYLNLNQPDPYNQNQYLSAAAGSPSSSNGLYNAGSIPSSSGTPSSSSTSGIETINNLFTKLGLFKDDVSSSSVLSNILSLGSGSMEGVLNRVNKFDSLKCIPRLLCQTIARRQQDASTTEKPNAKVWGREGKTVKFQGVDTALEQLVAFLDLVQLKDWSLYPYLKGAYEGSQVKRWDECAGKFSSCPFSDQQLVYYFNNYNGGFFQSFRSD